MLEFFGDEEKLDKDRFLRRSEKKLKVCPNEQHGSKLICNECKICLFVYSTPGLTRYPKVIWVIMGSSSKEIFKQHRSTGSEAYANKFVLLSSVCTLIETIFQKILTKPLLKNAKSVLFFMCVARKCLCLSFLIKKILNRGLGLVYGGTREELFGEFFLLPIRPVFESWRVCDVLCGLSLGFCSFSERVFSK